MLWTIPTVILFSLLLSCQYVLAEITNFLPQSFEFNYTPQGQAVPVPVTTQCETIHLTWARNAGDPGPSPVAPYLLQIYTSAFVFPFLVDAGSSLNFDWQVPFGPGTLYQICMFDKNGNTGGCQGLYTVIANNSTPSCNNATFPLGPLDVEAIVHDGPLSQYGWIDQCTDIQVTPKNGTPPYIFTVAPTLHPPWNITSDTMSSMNWTVQLSWASSFFISVVDADGNFWAYGPLHSGGNGPTTCLSKSSSQEEDDGVSKVTAIGAGVGGAIGGLLLGGAIAICFLRQRRKKYKTETYMDLAQGSPTHAPFIDPFPHTPGTDSHLSGNASTIGTGASTGYLVEPFTLPGEPRSPTDTNPRGSGHGHTGSGSDSAPGRNNVYVVHHDGGRAPITVYHADGTEIVELPPRYIDDSTGSTSRSGTSDPLGSDSARSEMGYNTRQQASTGAEPSSMASPPVGSATPGFLQQQRQPGDRPRKIPRGSRGQSQTSS
ncbi:hypothetical protein K435DRAFT_712148 [Dendrothele bispora CBS 962.96]|uniref:Fibronectin type-III domain-containing protein n=1 Tax=Dendrothele bispora (strain CBS 962.96) TaxID=1314807 RepID=A0A4S8MUL1_DENBC|nr:hypothetical protein K435DRAFT_712148 [Dendrothele bispora CBS 962.96]